MLPGPAVIRRHFSHKEFTFRLQNLRGWLMQGEPLRTLEETRPLDVRVRVLFRLLGGGGRGGECVC